MTLINLQRLGRHMIMKTFQLMFRSCIKNGKIPFKCKKGNVVHVYRKLIN